MKTTRKTFRSRISVLITLFILATSMPIFTYGFQITYSIGGVLLFIVIILTGIRYVISDGKLYSKMWFIPWGSIKIEDIVSVKRSYNPLSSPAASLKRLCIGFGNGKFGLISPVREDEFIETLKTINPNIEINIPETKGKWRIWDWDI
ncbi:MAG: PH domain-containing protein [Bacteroidales bacterium]|jgi:hypothetical protein|nr:PH domain-containing protein [Bacteroidales bacterium]